MTTLAEPRSKKVPTRSSARNRPVGPIDANATTEQLLAQRDALPAGHPGRIRLRALAIEKSLPMAYRLARRYAGRGEPLEDLAQVAALALMKAADGYDPSKGVPFHG